MYSAIDFVVLRVFGNITSSIPVGFFNPYIRRHGLGYYTFVIQMDLFESTPVILRYARRTEFVGTLPADILLGILVLMMLGIQGGL